VSLWTPTPSAEYLATIRADLDALVGTSLEYVGTIDGAWTVAAAELAWRADQGVALAVSTILIASAPPEALVTRALDRGITPRAATRSRYSLTSAGTGTIPAGTQVQGGGYLWTVLAESVVTPGTIVVVEAVDTGALALPSTARLTLVQPVAGVTSLTWDVSDGDPYQVGRVAESPAELRVRIAQARRSIGGSPEGIRTALLDLVWVVAADVASTAGSIAVTVSPGPVGTDQQAELGAAIYRTRPAGCGTTGASSVTTTDVNGDAVSIAYTAGSTQAVATVIALTLDGTVAAADAIAAAEEATRAVYAALSPGDPVYRLSILAGLALPGVTAATLTLDGSSAVSSVTPTLAADVLIPSPLTVTAS
jgi:hypothetical protein